MRLAGAVIIAAAIAVVTASVVYATEYELKWDTGNTSSTVIITNVGEGTWFANDFDVSTLGRRYVDRIKIMSSGYRYAPWDGFRIAIFDFDQVPGKIIWPTSGVPKFVKGSGSHEFDWCEFDVGWTLPPGNDAFVVGQEQFYLPPACDPYCFDDNVEHRWHTWRKATPTRDWNLHYSQARDKNVMIRVILTGDVGIQPASLGRVKALYH